MAQRVDTDDWDRLGAVAFVGHRGAGKSTLGRGVADRLGRPFVDLDDEIARRANRSVAEVLEADRAEFRRLEQKTLAAVCRRRPAPLIACGAGVETLPRDAFVVWLDREGWRREVRNSDRPRVRPQLTESAEWEWMETTRTPRWKNAAHLRVPIPRGRTVADSVRQLETLLRWAAATSRSTTAAKTWIVPSHPGELKRAVADAKRFGFAGVELRSDVFCEPAAVSLPDQTIASLRHDDPGWLNRVGDTGVWDIDARFTSAIRANPPAARPRRLIVSAHPQQLDPGDLRRLERAAETLGDALELRAPDIVLKYVATPRNPRQLKAFLDLASEFRASQYETTLLASGRHSWLRALFAPDNATSYLPVGLHCRHEDHPCPVDFADFLPHLAPPIPQRFDALVGDPVDHSRGDVWHRRGALAEDRPRRGYVKIPAGRGELDPMLELLERLPIRGVSVTSPLKVEAAESPRVHNPRGLAALNTLRCARNSSRAPWRGIDTDAEGMNSVLCCLEQREIGPGRAIVFGRGGASHAVVRALQSRDWTLIDHISARAGWDADHAGQTDIDLVVNAAGPDAIHTEHVPDATAWVDLHYNDVAPPPTGQVHLQGDPFFVAQARAQRAFWSDG